MMLVVCEEHWDSVPCTAVSAIVVMAEEVAVAAYEFEITTNNFNADIAMKRGIRIRNKTSRIAVFVSLFLTGSVKEVLSYICARLYCDWC